MICPKCKKEYSDDWKFCPDCSCELVKNSQSQVNKDEKVNLKKTITVSILLVLVLFVAANYMFTGKNSSNTNKAASPAARQVLLTAGFKNGLIIIKNDNNFDWTGTKIKVANGVTEQYSLNVGTIKSGEIKQYRLSEFTNLDGKKYDSYKHVPSQVLVIANNASGGMQY